MEEFKAFLFVIGIIFGLPIILAWVPIKLYDFGFKHGKEAGKADIEEYAVLNGLADWEYNTEVCASGKRNTFRWIKWKKL